LEPSAPKRAMLLAAADTEGRIGDEDVSRAIDRHRSRVTIPPLGHDNLSGTTACRVKSTRRWSIRCPAPSTYAFARRVSRYRAMERCAAGGAGVEATPGASRLRRPEAQPCSSTLINWPLIESFRWRAEYR